MKHKSKSNKQHDINPVHAWLLRRNVGIIGAYLLGRFERGGGVGITFDNDPWSPRSRAYDRGRGRGEWSSDD